MYQSRFSRGAVCMHAHTHPHTHTIRRFTLGSWLIWLWALASLKSVGRSASLKFRQSFCVTVLKQNSFSRKSLFMLKTFNWFDEIHLYYQEEFLELNLKSTGSHVHHCYSDMSLNIAIHFSLVSQCHMEPSINQLTVKNFSCGHRCRLGNRRQYSKSWG